MSNKTLEHTINILFLISLLCLSVWLASRLFFDKQNIPEIKTTQLQEQVAKSQLSDYDNFKTMKQLEVAIKAKTNGDVATGKSLKKHYRLNAKNSIESAYIYIEASVNGKPLGFYDDIYLKINNKGGHLILDDNLLPVPQSENVSAYLLPLASISYKPSRDAKKEKFILNNDFLSSINETQNINIAAHLNSKKKNKVLIKVVIGYDCLDDIKCEVNSYHSPS
jgi:hypothetical protein